MRRAIASVLFALMFAIVPMGATAQQASIGYAEILRGVDAHATQIRSVYAKYTCVRSLEDWYAPELNLPADAGTRTVTDCEWAFKGDKRYASSADPSDPELLTPHQRSDTKSHRTTTRIWDGKLDHNMDSANSSLGGRYHYDAIRRKQATPYESPLDCGYFVYYKWIGDVLRAGHGELQGTENDPMFGTLYLVSCIGDHDYPTRLWISPSHNFMAVRWELTFAVTTHISKAIVFRCTQARMVDGVWLPTAGLSEAIRRTDGTELTESTTDFKGISYELNSVPDSLFNPDLPPGSTVSDQAEGTMYKIGVHGEKILDERVSTKSNAMPMRWMFVLSVTALLVLIVGALERWRRHGARA